MGSKQLVTAPYWRFSYVITYDSAAPFCPRELAAPIEVLVHDKWVKAQYGWSGLANNYAFAIINLDVTTVTLTPSTQVRWPQI